MPTVSAPATSSTPILEVDSVSKFFGGTPALEDVSLTVRDGEFLTLLGPSGCGKTTLIRMIAGFESPTRGDIRIDGRSIVDAPPYRRPIGMVFQNLALFPHLSVFDNIAYGLRIRGMPAAAISAKVKKALDTVALTGYDHRFVGEISGGQRQRVALARAVITEPRVLLLDEPLGALDMKIRRQMQVELKQIQEELGTTFIFVTHDQEEALTMSDRIAVFRKGRIDQIATPREIYEQPATRFVAEFVGDTNFIEGVVQSVQGDSAVLQPDGRLCGMAVAQSGLRAGARAGASIRPQYLYLAPASNARLIATIERYAYAGQSVRAWLSVDGTALIADWRSSDVPELPGVGSSVGIGWDDTKVVAVPL